MIHSMDTIKQTYSVTLDILNNENMASNQISEDDFREYFEKKFGRNAQINVEQAWKLVRKFVKKANKDCQNNPDKDSDSSSDDEKPDKSKNKDHHNRRHHHHHHRKCSPHGHHKHGRRSSSSSSSSRSKS